MCLCSCARLCVSVMLGAGMCRCSGLLRSRRAQKKRNLPDREASYRMIYRIRQTWVEDYYPRNHSQIKNIDLFWGINTVNIVQCLKK